MKTLKDTITVYHWTPNEVNFINYLLQNVAREWLKELEEQNRKEGYIEFVGDGIIKWIKMFFNLEEG